MKKSEELREVVREKYAEIAVADASENKSCCTPACCTDGNKNSMADSYAGVKGYEPTADLGLGCGLPTEFAAIKRVIPWLIWVPVQETIASWQEPRQVRREKLLE